MPVLKVRWVQFLSRQALRLPHGTDLAKCCEILRSRVHTSSNYVAVAVQLNIPRACDATVQCSGACFQARSGMPQFLDRRCACLMGLTWQDVVRSCAQECIATEIMCLWLYNSFFLENLTLPQSPEMPILKVRWVQFLDRRCACLMGLTWQNVVRSCAQELSLIHI